MSGGPESGRSWAHDLARPPSLGRTLLWAGAAAAAFAAHAGAVALVLRETPILPASDGPPPAINIELAPLPEAANVDETELGQHEQNVDEVEEEPEPEEIDQPEPEPEPEPEEIEEPEPEPEPEPEEPQEELAEVEEAAVPIAAARPLPRPKREIRREEPRREVQREEPRREPPREEQPRQQQTRAAAEAPQATRNAAPQASAGRGASSNVSPAQWQSRLMAHLERRKRYPSSARSRRQEGTVHVNFTIDDRGNVLGISLAQSSGFPELDQAAVQAVQRASPVPAPPPGVNKNITAPMRFVIR